MHHLFIQHARLGARLWDIAVNKTDKVFVPVKFFYWGGIKKVFLSLGSPLYTLHSLLTFVILRDKGNKDIGKAGIFVVSQMPTTRWEPKTYLLT